MRRTHSHRFLLISYSLSRHLRAKILRIVNFTGILISVENSTVEISECMDYLSHMSAAN